MDVKLVHSLNAYLPISVTVLEIITFLTTVLLSYLDFANIFSVTLLEYIKEFCFKLLLYKLTTGYLSKYAGMFTISVSSPLS